MKLIIAALLALVTAQAAMGGVDHRPRGPKFSIYSPNQKRYLPAFQDNLYKYYRFAVKVVPTFVDFHDPTPGDQSSTTIVSIGDLFDKRTNVLVGKFDGSNLVTHATDVPGAPASVLQGTVFELGPLGDDTLAIQGGYDAILGAQNVQDHDLAVVGGTGQFFGAFGEVVVEGTDVSIVTVVVPKVRSF